MAAIRTSSALDPLAMAPGSRRDGRPARRPRRRLLELRGEGEQRLLVAEAPDELHTDGQAGVVPVQRKRDRRLARHVERRREGNVGRGAEQADEGLARWRVERAERRRRLAERRREQDVELLEGGGDLARDP